MQSRCQIRDVPIAHGFANNFRVLLAIGPPMRPRKHRTPGQSFPISEASLTPSGRKHIIGHAGLAITRKQRPLRLENLQRTQRSYAQRVQLDEVDNKENARSDARGASEMSSRILQGAPDNR